LGFGSSILSDACALMLLCSCRCINIQSLPSIMYHLFVG
jgi:hypothetical protein